MILLVLGFVGTDIDGVGFHLVVADDDHVGDSQFFSVSNAFPEGVVGLGKLDTDSFLLEHFDHLESIVAMCFCYGEDVHLGWREPGGEVAAEVLDEEADQAFVGGKRGTMDAERSFLLAVLVDVAQVEFFRDRKIELVGGEGEFAADDRPNLDVDFRSVEGCFIFDFDERDAGFFHTFADLRFGLNPELGFVHIFFS